MNLANKKNPTSFWVILCLGILLRIALAAFLIDLNYPKLWEYGEIARNIYSGHGFSYAFLGGAVRPTAYMMPGYVLLILPFMYIQSAALQTIGLISLQLILFMLAASFLFYSSENLFGKSAALMCLGLYAFIPEFVYATVSFTPVQLYHALLLPFIWLLYKGIKENIVSIILFSALLMYIRAEFILILFLALLQHFLKGYKKESLQVLLLAMLLLSPWVIRNYLLFDRFVPFTSSSGLNFYRGNNPDGIGDWGHDRGFERALNTASKSFEIEYNQLMMDEALQFIKKHPDQAIKGLLLKFIYFWVANPNDGRSGNAGQLLLSILLLISFGIGYYLYREHPIIPLVTMCLFASTVTAMIFFPLPRYTTMMRVVTLPFAAQGCLYLFSAGRKFFLRN